MKNKGNDKMNTVLFFGSYVEGDDLAFEIYDMIKRKIKGKKVVKCQSPFELTSYLKEGEIIIVDVVRGINGVRIFDDLDDFKDTQTVTIHDLDLGFFMKILETMKGAKFKIIGVPFGSRKEDVVKDVRRAIASV